MIARWAALRPGCLVRRSFGVLNKSAWRGSLPIPLQATSASSEILAAVEQDSHRAIIREANHHHRLKDARFDRHAE